MVSRAIAKLILQREGEGEKRPKICERFILTMLDGMDAR